MDKTSGLVHHVETTAANVHDVTLVPQLLYGEETSVHSDSGYLGVEKREDAVTHNHEGNSENSVFYYNRKEGALWVT